MPFATLFEWIIAFFLLLSSVGVITLRKPVHASLSFLVSLLALAALYLQLSADFIGVMQIIVYAGAILVIFIFVIVLFQDAHEQLARFKSQSPLYLSVAAGSGLVVALGLFASRLFGIDSGKESVSADYGTIQSLGKGLYLDFFFPFEAIVILFLIAVVGALYIAKKERN